MIYILKKNYFMEVTTMKQRKFVVIMAVLLIAVLCVGCLAACNDDNNYVGNLPTGNGYTHLDAVVNGPSTWNPHTYRTTDDAYPGDLTKAGLYEFFFNEDKTGYEIWPVMAASEPVDVTEELKAEAKWEIPASATEGYAYTIALNPNAKWDDGTPINADSYVESMKRLLNPAYLNYRASNYYTGDLQIFGGKEFNKQGAPIFEPYVKDDSGRDYPNVEDGNVPQKDTDGSYYVMSGDVKMPVVVALEELSMFFGDGSIQEYYDAYGLPYFGDADGVDLYESMIAGKDKYNTVVVTDEVIATLKTFVANFGDPKSEDWVEFCHVITGIGADYDWNNVGIYKSGDYEITIVLNKSLKGFYLLYNLTDSWLVHLEKYDRYMTEANGIYNSTYNTNVETAASTGPYKLTTYDQGKLMVFQKNDNFVGYGDPRFAGLYQTTTIRTEVVQEASTRKQMFFKGELDTYGLQAADYSQYRQSDFFYTSPGTTVFFLTLVGNENMLKAAEAGATNVNKTILANDKFREALSLSFDKDNFAATISPSRTGAFSVIGSEDIWNPSSGEKYRDTVTGKEVLATYYGFEKQGDGTWKLPTSDTRFTLDEAVDAVTGYNPDQAKALFLEAYNEWLDAGKIDADDVVEITYASSGSTAFQTKTLDYLNQQINNVLAGTALENRVKIVESAALEDWSGALRSGQAQTCLCGWNGGMLNPFGTMLYYTFPEYDPYAENWWDTASQMETLTLDIDGVPTEITMSVNDWSLCLNGDVITVGDKEYNFGYGQVADSVRLQILAGLEKVILATNYYIPMLQDGSGFLLTRKVNYALGPDDYNAVLGRGGIAYMTYNYNDSEWADYVASKKGKLAY